MNKNKNKKFWTEFLEIYKSLPVLWCVKSPEYSNRRLKSDAYNILIKKLKEIDPKADRECAVRKINNFRSSYRRELSKLKKSEQAEEESRNEFVSSLWYFDLLHFLNDQRSNYEGESTVYENNNCNYVEGEIRHPTQRPSKRKCTYKEDIEDEEFEVDHAKLTPTVIWNHQESNNDAEILAKSWETQYSELPSDQKVFVRKLFSDVLFNGCLGKLNGYVVTTVHSILESSCPSLTS